MKETEKKMKAALKNQRKQAQSSKHIQQQLCGGFREL